MYEYTTELDLLAEKACDCVLESLNKETNDIMQNIEKRTKALAQDFFTRIMKRVFEKLDENLFYNKENEVHVEKKRERTLVTTLGELSFVSRMYKDQYGNSRYLLDELLNIPKRSRFTPLAKEYLVVDGVNTTYATAADIFSKWSGASVSKTCVMDAIRQTAEKIKKDSLAKTEDLFVSGVIEKGKIQAEEIFIEADATYVPKQGADGKTNTKRGSKKIRMGGAPPGFSEKEIKKRQKRIDKARKAISYKVVKYEGNGYEYPVQGSLRGASAEVRYAAGLYQGKSSGEY